MNPRFIIDRPIFAWVVARCILLGGVLTLRALPIEQYPTVARPSLTIRATYPGADAATLDQNVNQVIEQELKERKSVVSGKSVSVRAAISDIRIIKNKTHQTNTLYTEYT